jgi:hypothetical protein
MSEAGNISSSLLPDLKAVIYAVGGFLLSHVWAVFRARRASVSWTATFQKITPSLELVSSKISILLNDHPCQNLQWCQVAICNESGRDIESFDLLFTFFEPFAILEGHGSVASSAKNLFLSNGFVATATNVSALPEADRSKNASFQYLHRNREFHLLALNRGEKATFNFWINSSAPNDAPRVLMTTEKAGVKLVSRPSRLQMLDFALFKTVIPIGLLLSLAVAFTLSKIDLSPLTLALGCCFSGCCSGLIGIVVVLGFRRLKQFI